MLTFMLGITVFGATVHTPLPPNTYGLKYVTVLGDCVYYSSERPYKMGSKMDTRVAGMVQRYNYNSSNFQGYTLAYYLPSITIGYTLTETNLLSTNYDMLNNSDNTVFFSPMVPTILTPVIPQLKTMGGSIVSPRLLVVCVTLLCLFLGVQLVPRLIHLFL
jgi:hypothetical protein